MLRIYSVIGIMSILFFLSGCWLKGGQGSPMGFKRITQSMERQMEQHIFAGCDKEYQYYDREIAVLYSIIPGGGQWYTGEKKKAWLYLFSAPLIVPYFVSFQDAQNSVDYYNFRYTARFCKSKSKISKKMQMHELKSFRNTKASRKLPKHKRKR